jgi:hypothetical protein
MTLEQLIAQIDLVVKDSDLAANYPDWINAAISELAADFDLPALRRIDPAQLAVTEYGWLYDMPENYQKGLFRARNGNYGKVHIARDIDDIHRKDIDHDQVEDAVAHVGVQDRKLGVFPKANDTLYLWFYEAPAPLVEPGDKVTCIPAEYQARVIIPKLVVKNFTILQDLVIDAPHQSIAFWQAELQAGLYGRPHGEIGLLNFLVKARGIRRHGGRDPLP